jgi:serine O-acetyltransferase
MRVTDLSRAYRLQKGPRRWKIIRCYLNQGYRAVKVYRFEHWLRVQPFLLKMLLMPLGIYLHQRMRRKWGIDISPLANIGPGFQVFHFGGIFIGDVTIGRNCSVRQDTTIGVGGSGAGHGVPTIGNGVDIAPGVVIAGKIKIGDGARIGANVVIQRDIPPYTLVQSRPPQMVSFPEYGFPSSRNGDKAANGTVSD